MSDRSVNRQEAIDALKGWYPMGWRKIGWGECSCCGTDMSDRMELHKEPIGNREMWGQSWTQVCYNCYLRWEELNRDHVVAWEMMR